MELAPYLCYQLDFLLDFLLKISLISTYKMPPRLLYNLLKALSNLSPNIRNIESFHTEFFRPEVTSQPHLHTSEHEEERRKWLNR